MQSCMTVSLKAEEAAPGVKIRQRQDQPILVTKIAKKTDKVVLMCFSVVAIAQIIILFNVYILKVVSCKSCSFVL